MMWSPLLTLWCTFFVEVCRGRGSERLQRNRNMIESVRRKCQHLSMNCAKVSHVSITYQSSTDRRNCINKTKMQESLLPIKQLKLIKYKTLFIPLNSEVLLFLSLLQGLLNLDLMHFYPWGREVCFVNVIASRLFVIRWCICMLQSWCELDVGWAVVCAVLVINTVYSTGDHSVECTEWRNHWM